MVLLPACLGNQDGAVWVRRHAGIKLVENRTKYANKIHGLLSDHGITEDVKPLNVEGREFLRELSLPTPWDALLESYLELIETLTKEIQDLEETIEERAGSLRETQLLMTIPGVSYYTALTIYAELGEIDRFDCHKEVVSYVGLNPVIRESPDSRIEGSISKRDQGEFGGCSSRLQIRRYTPVTTSI